MTDYPQDLIDAARRAWVQEVDASPDDDDITSCVIAVIDAVDRYRAAHATPAPDVSDEAIVVRDAGDERWDKALDVFDGTTWGPRAAMQAAVSSAVDLGLVLALARSSAAVDVPENVWSVLAVRTRPHETWAVSLMRDDQERLYAEGHASYREALAAAIADSSGKGGEG